MNQRDQFLEAIWLAARAQGGAIRISKHLLDDYPGAKHVWITTRKDTASGDLVIEAHTDPGKGARP